MRTDSQVRRTADQPLLAGAANGNPAAGRPGARRRGRSSRWALAGALLLLPTAWAQPLAVVASLHPWADVVRQVGGDAVEVTTLLPAGASPHSFEPVPSQAALLDSADLVVVNGGLDRWLERLLDAAAPQTPRFVVLERVPFAPLDGHDHDEDHDDEDEHDHLATANPHVWLDPEVAAAAAQALAEELALLRPERADAFRANAAAFAADLEALTTELNALLSPARGVPFVPYHDAWPYFARRFGLKVAATLEPFPGREPSARYVAETVATIRRVGARVVFDERQLSGRTAAVVAEAAGVRVVMLDPIGGAPGPETYQELLRHNAALIAGAVGGE